MASTLNTNIYSLLVQKNLSKNQYGMQTAIERLSSGKRVNSARDDASGLARGMVLDADSRVLGVQIRNTMDTISTAQTSEGYLSGLNDILQRMNELRTGDNASSPETMKELTALSDSATSLISSGGSSISVSATDDLTTIQKNIETVAGERATLGATMNVAEFDIEAKQIAYTNNRAAYSRIMDADYAEETSRLSRYNILQQAGVAMLAQANAQPNTVLTLLNR